MRFVLPVLLAVLVGCSRSEHRAPDATPAAEAPRAPLAIVDAAPRPDVSTVTLRLVERPGGPTLAQCKQAAGSDPWLTHLCLETSTPDEVKCVLEAPDRNAVAECERFRRQVPADFAGRTEVNQADCERVFLRLKQFKMAEGVPAEQIDETRDQVIRSCLEKASIGTVACFLASWNYEDARKCP